MKISTVCRVGARKALTSQFKKAGAIDSKNQIVDYPRLYATHKSLKRMMFEAYGFDRELIVEDTTAPYIQFNSAALDEIEMAAAMYSANKQEFKRNFSNDKTLTAVDLVKKYVVPADNPSGLRLSRYVDWSAEQLDKFKNGMKIMYPGVLVRPVATRMVVGEQKYSVQFELVPQSNVEPLTHDEKGVSPEEIEDREAEIVTAAIEPLLKAFKNARVNWVTEAELREMFKGKKPKVIATKGFSITGVVEGRDIYLVKGKVTPASAVEEFMHMFVDTLNIERKALYLGLLREAQNNYPLLAAKIAIDYSDENGFSKDDRDRELISKALSDAYLREREERPTSIGFKDFLKLAKEFFKWLTEKLGTALNIELDTLPLNATIGEIATLLNVEGIQFPYVEATDVRFNLEGNKEISDEFEENDLINEMSTLKKRTIKDIKIERSMEQEERLKKILKRVKGKKVASLQGAAQTIEKLIEHTISYRENVLELEVKTVSVSKFAGKSIVPPRVQKSAEASINFGLFHHFFYENLMLDALDSNMPIGEFIRENPNYFDEYFDAEITLEDGTVTTNAKRYLNYPGMNLKKVKRDIMKVVDIIAADNLDGILIPEITIYGNDSMGRVIDGRLDYIIVRRDGTIVPKDFKTHKARSEQKVYNDGPLDKSYVKGRLADGVHPLFEAVPNRTKYSDYLTQISIYSRLLKQNGFQADPGSIISIIYYPDDNFEDWTYKGIQVADVPIVGTNGMMMNRDAEGNATADIDPRYERIVSFIKDALPIEGEVTTNEEEVEEVVDKMREIGKLDKDAVNLVLKNLKEKITAQLEEVKRQINEAATNRADEEKVRVLRNRKALLNEANLMFPSEKVGEFVEIEPSVILRSVLEKTFEIVDKLRSENKNIYKNTSQVKEKIQELTARHKQLADMITFLKSFDELLNANGFTAESEVRKEVRNSMAVAMEGQQYYIDLAKGQMVNLLMKVNRKLAERMMESMRNYYKFRKPTLERIAAGDATVMSKSVFWLGGKVNKIFNSIIGTPKEISDDMKDSANEELKKIEFWEKNQQYDRNFVEMYVNNTFNDPSSGFYIGSTITPRSTSWSGDDFVASFGNSELAIAAMSSYGIHMTENAKNAFFDKMEELSIDQLFQSMTAKYGSYENAVAAISQEYTFKDLRTGINKNYMMFLTPYLMAFKDKYDALDYAVVSAKEKLDEAKADPKLSETEKEKLVADLQQQYDKVYAERKEWYLQSTETKLMPEVYKLEVQLPVKVQEKIEELREQIRTKLEPKNPEDEDFGLIDSVVTDVQKLEFEISTLMKSAIEENPNLADVMEKYRKYYKYDVNYNGFEYQKNWMIKKYGEDSKQFKAWLKLNSELVPADSWYERVNELMSKKQAIFGSDPTLTALYERQNELKNKYKFKSRYSAKQVFNPLYMSDEDYQELTDIETEIENIFTSERPKGSRVRLTKQEKEELTKINNELDRIRSKEPKASYVREFNSLKEELINLRVEIKKASIDPNKQAELAHAQTQFTNREIAFKAWYDRNNKSEYLLGTIERGGSVSMDPREFNMMRVPTDKNLMIRVPSSRWRKRSYSEAAYNPNYSPLIDKRAYGPGNYASPKGIKYDRDTGRYIVDPKSPWANPRYVAMMNDPTAMDYYNKIVMDLYINKQVTMSAQKLGHYYPSVTQAGFDSVAQNGFDGLKREWNEAVQSIKLYESDVEKDINEFGLTSNARVRFPHNSLWTSDLTTKDGLNAILKWNLSYEINQSMEEANLLMSPAIDFLKAKATTVDNELVRKQIEKVVEIWEFERNKFIYGQTMETSSQGLKSNIANRKMLRNLLGVVSWSRLAFDPAMQVGNLISGNVQAFLAGEIESNGVGGTKNLAWAKGQMYSPGGFFYKVIENWGELSGVNLETKILRFFNPSMKDFDRMLDVTSRGKMRRLLTRAFNVKDIAFIIQDKGEMEIAMTTMLKNLDANKFNVFDTDTNGNFILDENGNRTYKKDAQGNIVQVTAYEALVNNDKAATPGIRPDVDMQMEDLEAIKSATYIEYLKFQGNYSNYMKPKVESSMAGLLMTFFRKYLVPSVETRFKGMFGIGDPKNWTAGRIQVGWWTAMFQIARFGERGSFVEAILPGFAAKALGMNKLDSFYQSKAMQARRELMIATLATISFAVLRGLVYNDDDDEEEMSWAALQSMRVMAKVNNETRSLMWLPPIGKADDYISNFSTFTTAFNEAKVLSTLFSNTFWYTTAGMFDWEYAKEMGFYERRAGRYEKGDPKVLANLIKLTGIENILDIWEPEYSVKELYKRKQ